MPLAPGTHLGGYEILALVGEGGMGQVYRARDMQLGRHVAIKVLPELFATDEARTGRLKTEAKALAALNHPRIATLFGMEADGDRQFLIMELVDGETLADRLHRGAMPLGDVLRIAGEIADALEAAHEKGIVHRDLKPANVKIAADDRVKVLDFGLARLGAEPSASGGGVTHSPTLSIMATQAGVILGTAAYMSPEQAKGLPADQRSDVFSFGVVLFEMLTGRQPFHGDTAAEVLASVMIRDADLGSLPPTLNPRLRDLVRRCLQKNPKQRWQHIGDVRAEIEHIAADPHASQDVAASRPTWRLALPIVVTALVVFALTAAGAWLLRPAASTAVVTRFTYGLPSGLQLPPAPNRSLLAVSPDGSQFVFAADTHLYLKPMSEFQARLLAGADLGAQNQPGTPVFSPDGRWIAFYTTADGALKKIATSGGAAFTICPLAGPPIGITWSDDEILFGSPQGVMSVSANGGTPTLLIGLKNGEFIQRPQRLPGRDAILFTLTEAATAWDQARIVAQSMKTGQRTVLVNGGTDGRYVPTGHLVYASGGVMFAVPLDVGNLTVSGGPVPVIEGVRRAASATGSGATQLAVSTTGTVVYVPGPASAAAASSARALVISDRSGATETLKIPPANFVHPRVSPNGKRIAFGIADDKGASISVYDLAGATAARRLTFGGKDHFPIWSADSQHVTFQSDREGDLGVFWQNADGGTPERLTKAEAGVAHIPESWSPDGETLLLSVMKDASTTLWMLSRTDKTIKPFPNVQSQVPIGAVFSPDGHWVAYATSNTPGPQDTVYVQPFPPNGTKYQISRAGEDGHHPVWSPDGKELTFIPNPGRLTSVTLTFSPSFAIGNPVELQRRFTLENAPANTRSHDITPDGKRFIGIVLAAGNQDSAGLSNTEIRVILNWFDELKARVPTR